MVFNEKNLEKKLKVEEKISQAVEQTIERMPLPEKEKAKMAEKAEEAEQWMHGRFKELTGRDEEFDSEQLYRQMVREMMMKVNWIDKGSMCALKDVYKKEGRIGRLAETTKKYASEIGSQLKISKEAEDFEDMTMLFIRHAEGGLISPQYFMKHLFAHLENEAVRKKEAELEIVPQKNVTEDDALEKDPTKGKTEKEEYDTFLQMSENRRSQYAAAKKEQKEKKVSDWGALGNSEKTMFKRLKSDPAISSDLEKWTNRGGEMHNEIEDMADLRAGKTLRQAELSGFDQKFNLHI